MQFILGQYVLVALLPHFWGVRAVPGTANIVLFQQANLCGGGTSATVNDLDPGLCADFGFFGACMVAIPQSPTSPFTAAAFRTGSCQNELEQAQAFVCICPTGDASIRGAKWLQATNVPGKRDLGSSNCTTVKPDTFTHTENGVQHVVRSADSPDIVASILQGLEDGSLTDEDLKKTILSFGVKTQLSD
ncbi:hypothetical protein AYO21_04513 [Fonsecaea monophora]|uniref:Uncharacterized protein n=1 Tax=Fonsecaea monophora TaxID=254056 RepID=A0A177FA38_9EURO|nr:hypothetical protein AYO21_04513 [Fonsecaea monophora]KAH0837047.1 hypothetical protein FOPE_04851 [Fonsecaea pedrosoi]OAG41133.1 hypothetical protein AYO21_04513 [Fonsecaea monophora]